MLVPKPIKKNIIYNSDNDVLKGIINNNKSINANAIVSISFPSNLLNNNDDIAAPPIDPIPLAMNIVPNSVEPFKPTFIDICPKVEHTQTRT